MTTKTIGIVISTLIITGFMAGSVGCTYSKGVPTFSYSGVPVSAPTVPTSTPSAASDPKSDATGDTVTPPSAETPPAIPPAKGPGADEKPPIVIVGKAAGLAPVPQNSPAATPEPVVKTSIILSDPETVSCDGCAAGEGDSKIFRCPDNYVVTGFESAVVSGSDDATTIALQIKCSLVTDLNISPEGTEFATVFPTGETLAGDSTATIVPVDDPTHPFTRTTSCPIYSGVANGVVGRLNGKLDTFGLACANYYRSGPSVDFLSTSKRTSANADIEFGSEFSKKCPEDTALVGLQIRYSSDKVRGIDNLFCSGPSLLTYCPYTGCGK